MAFPAYVHSIIDSSDDAAWPVQGQGEYEWLSHPQREVFRRSRFARASR